MSESLERRMRDVLVKASTLSEVAAAGMGKPVSQGKAEDKIPTSSGTALRDVIQSRFSGCVSDVERLRQVEWAERQVARAKRQRPRELTKEQKDYWILVDSQGKDYQTVALEHDMRPETVWKIRRDCPPPLGPLDPRTGHPKPSKKAA